MSFLPLSNNKASMLDFHLDLNGIACSKGSACQSGSSNGSHVLNEIQDEKFKNSLQLDSHFLTTIRKRSRLCY
ncbi:MAG: hypothetical protein CM15mP102_10570 [Flavobacteriales bacterium]|nr:MAG: hypothetical protein CM15mP102_10570 [Flavobacteriales bacterium]